MDGSRGARLTYLRSQIRFIKQPERRLILLQAKRSETAEELIRVRQHLQDAEAALTDLLRRNQLRDWPKDPDNQFA